MTAPISHNRPGSSAAGQAVMTRELSAHSFSTSAVPDSVATDVAAFLGRRTAFVTSSGTTALQAAMLGAGVRPGQPVIVPVLTCPAVVHAVQSIGAVVVPVDVGPDRPVLDAAHLDCDVDGAVVVAPHMFGARVDIGELVDRGASVIEDAAQALAPQSSTRAAATVISLSPTKLLTVGYAGAVACDDEQIRTRLERVLDIEGPGLADDVDLDPPIPFRIQAAVSAFQQAAIPVELARWEAVVARRRAISARYVAELPELDIVPVDVPFRHLVVLPPATDAASTAAALLDRGVGATPTPSHLLHDTFGWGGSYPNAERWHRATVSIPLHEAVSDDDADRVIDAVREVLGL